MNSVTRQWIVLVLSLIYYPSAMAIEEPTYQVERKYESFEVRKYGPILAAQTEIADSFGEAGNKAFRILADYIFGNNSADTKIEMTAPVTQQGEKIAMTAPVNMTKSTGGFMVQFTMPAKFTRETLPKPNDPRVKIIEIPARRVAVYSYSGSWSETKFQNKLQEFRDALKKEGIETSGEPIFARFNSPFRLWFLRRNEIWLELKSVG